MKQRCFSKHTLLLILIALSVNFAAVAANFPKVSLNVSDVPMEQVLKKIEQQTDFRFSFKKSALSGLPPVSMKCQNQVLDKVLNKLFEKTGMTS